MHRLVLLAVAAVVVAGLIAEQGRAASEDPLLQRSVTISVTEERLRDVLMQLFRQVGAKLEFDTTGLASSAVDLDQKVTINAVDRPLWQVLDKLVDRRKNPDVYVEPYGDNWVLTSLRIQKSRADLNVPDWIKANGRVHSATVDHHGDVWRLYRVGAIEDEFFRRLPELSALRALQLSSTTGVTAEQIRQLSKVATLEDVQLNNVNDIFKNETSLGDEAIQALAAVPSLRRLSLTNCGTSDKGAEALAGMSQLRELLLSGEGLMTDESLRFIGKMSQLKVFTLQTHVRTAKLGAPKFTAEGYRHLNGMANLEGLAVVNAFYPVSIEGVTLPKLKWISLSGTAASDASAASLSTMPSLIQIAFERDVLTDDGLRSLAKLPNLAALSFESQSITPAGLAQLRQCSHLTSLKTSLPATDESLEKIAGMQSLRKLTLASVPTSRGFALLKSMPELRTLWLNGSAGQLDLEALRGLKQLQSLTLQLEGLTQATVDEVRLKLPDTIVTPQVPPIMSGGFTRVPMLK